MERLAKGMRTACGLLLLLNLVVFFVPVTKIERQNSPGRSELTYSQMDYVTSMLREQLPHDEYLEPGQMEVSGFMTVACFMLLPLLLSAAGGAYGIAGSPSQMFTGVSSLLSAGCYAAQYVRLSGLWPAGTQNLRCVRSPGSYLAVIVPCVAALFGILTFILVPRVNKESRKAIPGGPDGTERMQEAKEGQAGYVIRGAGGVMTGLAGIYEGAEIEFYDGMAIRLGRLPDNDLIFVNEMQVSRRHCEITWHAAENIFTIRDFSSSGSYIHGSGARVPQNVETPLSPGTILDIGDERNRFRLG